MQHEDSHTKRRSAGALKKASRSQASDITANRMDSRDKRQALRARMKPLAQARSYEPTKQRIARHRIDQVEATPRPVQAKNSEQFGMCHEGDEMNGNAG